MQFKLIMCFEDLGMLSPERSVDQKLDPQFLVPRPEAGEGDLSY